MIRLKQLLIELQNDDCGCKSKQANKILSLINEDRNKCPDMGQTLKSNQFINHSKSGVPYNYIFKNPFGDGHDYQYFVWDGNCTRTWIRRNIKAFNNEPIYKNNSDAKYNLTYGMDPSAGGNVPYITYQTNKTLWTKLDKLVKQKVAEYKRGETVRRAAYKEGNTIVATPGFTANIKTKEQGNAFRKWVNNGPERLSYAVKALKAKGLEGKFDTSGSHTNNYIKIVWDTKYGNMTLGDWYVAKVLSKTNTEYSKQSNKEMLIANGFNVKHIDVNNYKSANHMSSLVYLEGLRDLTQQISAKSISGGNGDVEIKILNPKGSGYYLGHLGKQFSAKLGSYLFQQKICGHYGKANEIPATYGCWLYDIYFDYNKIKKAVDDAFAGNPHAIGIPGYFPDGITQFFSSYFGTSSYKNALAGVKTYTSKMCNKVQSIDPSLQKARSRTMGDRIAALAKEVGLTTDNIRTVGEFMLPFIPGIGPYVYGAIAAGKSVNAYNKGDYIGGTLYAVAALAPFAKTTKIYKLNKNLNYPITDLSKSTAGKIVQKLAMKQVKGVAKEALAPEEKDAIKAAHAAADEIAKEAKVNIATLESKYGKDTNEFKTAVNNVVSGKKQITDYI